MKRAKVILSVLFIWLFSNSAIATIINVPADQPTIQAGINAASNGDTVLVQPDTFVENINYNGKNITVASLFLTTQDTSYISQTVIDGDSYGNVVVKFENEEDSTSILTGFTITNGSSSYGGGIYCYNSNPSLENVTITCNHSPYGGGIYCDNSSPSLINVTITDNSANSYGGGIYCDNSSPNLENVTITGNYAYSGGGIYCRDNSSPSLENVKTTGNSASNAGGGIYCKDNSSPSLENVTITGNSASDEGGGICCRYGSSPSLVNVTILGNSADWGGGIFCSSYSSPSVENVIITGNYAIGPYGRGGGIYCRDNSSPSLANVIILGNSTVWGGGIYCEWYSCPSLVNVTITDNSSDYGGGIFCLGNSTPVLINCILWNDTPQEIYIFSGSVTATYSDIQGGWTGEGNIDADPLFVGTGELTYSLQEGSPCIDAGNPDSMYNDPEDPDNPGYALYPSMGTIINDMGAYGGPNTLSWIPPVSVEDNLVYEPMNLHLYQNYPNPFNPETKIRYLIPQDSRVELKIYNIKGQFVKTLFNQKQKKGTYTVIWNGLDDNGKPVSSGIYFYKIETDNFTRIKKAILLK